MHTQIDTYMRLFLSSQPQANNNNNQALLLFAACCRLAHLPCVDLRYWYHRRKIKYMCLWDRPIILSITLCIACTCNMVVQRYLIKVLHVGVIESRVESRRRQGKTAGGRCCFDSTRPTHRHERREKSRITTATIG